MASLSQEALSEFAAECEEIQQRVSTNLAKLEENSASPEVLDALYRDMHTMKGSAHLFGFGPLGNIAHAMEACLSALRSVAGAPSKLVVDALFEGLGLVDRFRIDGFESKELGVDVTRVVSKLVEASTQLIEALPPEVRESSWVEDRTNDLRARIKAITAPMQISNKGRPASASVPEKREVLAPPASPPTNNGMASQAASAVPASETVRLRVDLVDRIMNLVGELVLVRNQMLSYTSQTENSELLSMGQSIDLVASDLQTEVMKTRMQPVSALVGKFPRLVRDIANQLNKKIKLTIEGSETELDRTVLEAVKDPLVHILRNSCDHGIETPDQRKEAGKPEEGHVVLRAFHESGQVALEVRDDGRGLDPEKLLQKALEKGLIDESKAETMSKDEIYGLIFAPGFSTAAKVSSVSGRGVGMDVVKNNIESIGGRIELESELGKGSRVTLRIPLTMAIVPAMLVRSGDERYAISQSELRELVGLGARYNGEHRLEEIENAMMIRLRGNLLSVISLNERLNLKEAMSCEDQTVVVLHSGGRPFGLLVDEVLETTDIVVKPLADLVRDRSVFSGATVLGDGKVALILDINGIAPQSSNRTAESKNQLRGSSLDGTSGDSFIVFKISDASLYGVQLSQITRLENFSEEQIEFSGKHEVIRYRGQVLYLVDIDRVLLPELAKSDEKNFPVIVIETEDRIVGLRVSEIVDIESVEDLPREETSGSYVRRRLVMNERVVSEVDVAMIVDHYFGADTKANASSVVNSNVPTRPKILYAEDMAFIRKSGATFLEKQGFEVVACEDGAIAWEKLEGSEPGEFVALVSDIEMPNMNGLELASKISESSRFSGLPMIAVTTKSTDSDKAKGEAAGFAVYLDKAELENTGEHLKKLLKERG